VGNKKKLLSTRILLPVVLSVILLISLVIMAAACNQQEQDTDKIGVVVTILPQAEFVGSIGGDRVEITVMVPPGASPHTYEPTPSQMVALSEAEMYAKVGSGIDFELAGCRALADDGCR